MSAQPELLPLAGGPLHEATEPVELRPDQRLALDDPRILWFVTAGAVDLFAAELVDRQPVGRWHFLCRLTAGTAMMGCPAGPRHSLVGRPTPGTSLRRCTVAATKALTALADGAGPALVGAHVAGGVDGHEQAAAALALQSLASAVDATLTRLAETLDGGRPPREFVPLEPGQLLAVPAGATVRTLGGVVWAEILEGRLHFRSVGGEDVRRRGELCPLTQSDWLLSTEPSRTTGLTTGELAADGRLWPHLLVHLVRQMYAFDRRLEDRVSVERRALVQGSDYDQEVGARATRGLAAVLRQVSSRVRLADVAMDDPPLAAARLVGARLGVRVVAPATGAWFDPMSDEVTQIAAASGLHSRRVRLDGRWWRTDAGPMVGRLAESGQPVALLPDRRGYALVPPGGDRAVLVTEALASTLEPEAVTLYRPLPTTGRLDVRRLLAFGAHGSRADLVRLVLSLAVASGVGLVVPVITGKVLGDLVPRGERTLIVQACLLVIGLAVVSGTSTLLQQLALLRIEGRLDTQVQAAIWSRLLTLPVSFFTRWSTGELSTAALGVSAIRDALSGVIVTAAVAFVVGLANLLLLALYDPVLALVALGLFLAGSAVSAWIGYRQVRQQRQLVEVEQRLSSRAFQLLGGVSKIRVSAAEERAFAHWSELFATSRTLAYTTRRLQNVLTTFSAGFVTVCSLVLFWLVGGPYAGRLDTAAFLSFYVAFSQLLASSAQFTGAAIGVLNIVPMFENLRPVLDGVPEQQHLAHDPGELVGAIELSHVTFGYDAEAPPVIDDVDLRIEPGEFVAVVGPTGCGKSTLLRLLLGFVEPRSGSILYDDQDLAELDVTAVRRQCGVVLQTGTVFAGDLLTNIIGASRHTEQDAWEAVRMAGLEEDVRAMPMGLHTVLSDGGGTLSAGQRQRLMVARALLSKPRLLFFDEATSALDNPTQEVVAESTRRLNATRLVIAHRLSTVAGADRIVVMDKGRIVQVGSYDELVADTGGLFHALTERQLA